MTPRLFLTAAILSAFGGLNAFANEVGERYSGSFGEHMYWGGMTGFWMGPLMMIAFVVLIVVAVVLVLRWIGPASAPGNNTAAPGTAADILRERYARGEIDEAEFRQRLEVLSAGR